VQERAAVGGPAWSRFMAHGCNLPSWVRRAAGAGRSRRRRAWRPSARSWRRRCAKPACAWRPTRRPSCTSTTCAAPRAAPRALARCTASTAGPCMTWRGAHFPGHFTCSGPALRCSWKVPRLMYVILPYSRCGDPTQMCEGAQSAKRCCRFAFTVRAACLAMADTMSWQGLGPANRGGCGCAAALRAVLDPPAGCPAAHRVH